MPERREEGGFILRDPTGNLSVARWPKGLQNSIILPAHANCKIGDQDIVASFHTHPNIEPEYLQEPSETDKRAVRNDPNLKGAFYEGEYVISQRTIYLINPVGQVSEVGNTEEVLSER
jgi:proteasome lid subunit RPN8/RPN11